MPEFLELVNISVEFVAFMIDSLQTMSNITDTYLVFVQKSENIFWSDFEILHYRHTFDDFFSCLKGPRIGNEDVFLTFWLAYFGQ